MSSAIAVIGIGCRYPDAQNPNEFWENILAQRRAFRRIPDGRLPLKDYYSADRSEPDKTYSMYAALIHEFDFDRVRYRIAGSTFRATDIAQWLALQVAADALADAGYPDAENLPRDTTGVVLGNTLAGEMTRANTLRLRWPYVQKVLRHTLTKSGIPAEQQPAILREAEQRYKVSFPPVNHENLAGGLSNTIPGRICNHFDFHGGGYTVDGACASSLLAITTACSQLESHDLDVAVAGGVDISLDPFELVGFAKMGALAEHEMLVYDSRSAGFLPGEGCGIVVLKRLEDAVKDGNRIYAVVKGWGVSSDGQGGLTTPSSNGQSIAIRRAYARAGYGIESSAFIEGHGTGTTVGDKVELVALAGAVNNPEQKESSVAIGVGSVKANIGHTKAAAGIAGFIKATLALHRQVIPPMPGCGKPHQVFREEAKALYPLRNARLPGRSGTIRAGVSAFGFGGINTHVALESSGHNTKSVFTPHELLLMTSKQDSEVFLFSAKRSEDLKAILDRVQSFAVHLSHAEMTDLAAALAGQPSHRELRAAIVASHPEELYKKIERLSSLLVHNGSGNHFSHIDLRDGVFASRGQRPPKIGFLYPGQGVQQVNMTRPLYERYDFVRSSFQLADTVVGPVDGLRLSEYIFRDLDHPAAGIDNWKLALTQTQVAQPAIVAASVATTSTLAHFGIAPSLAIGYSLGEWAALWSAGVLSENDLYKCVAARGRAMARRGQVQGTMATVAASPEEVQELLKKITGYVVIAGYNTPKQAVISGEAAAVNAAIALCRRQGFAAIPLRVSNAFHSALVSSSTEVLRKELSAVAIAEPRHYVISTITGQDLRLQSLKEDLCTQILEPVRFQDAMSQAEQFGVDVLVEVGPGRSLASMMEDIELSGLQALLCTEDHEGTSLRAMNVTLGCLFALGAHVKTQEIYAARFTRPFSLDYHPRFILNPCETRFDGDQGIDEIAGSLLRDAVSAHSRPEEQASGNQEASDLKAGTEAVPHIDQATVVQKLLDLASEITEYPRHVIKPEQLLLRDLNLNSIASAQLVAEAARRLGLPRPADAMEYSTCSLQDVAGALFEMLTTQKPGLPDVTDPVLPEGISPWVRSCVVEMREELLPPTTMKHLREFKRCLLISEEHHPFAKEYLERLTARGVDVESCTAASAEAEFETLFSAEQEYDGVVVVLPHDCGKNPWDMTPGEFSAQVRQVVSPLSLFGKHFARWISTKNVFVGIVQFGGGAFGRGGVGPSNANLSTGSGFLKSLFLELGLQSACIVDLAPEMPSYVAASTVLTEFQQATGFVEVGYTADNTRRVPLMKLADIRPSGRALLGSDDVLLVSGGGRGIGAECAVALATEYGCKVALIGRTDPDGQTTSKAAQEIRTTIARLLAAGVQHSYAVCDVADASQLAKAVERIETSLGPVTAMLHAAGNNTPQSLKNLDSKNLYETLAPKIDGTVNMFNAVPAGRLKTFITFGSIIGQTGMRGEAAYAFANDWMNSFMVRVQQLHPSIRCFSLNWSVWSEIGMGEQLGSVNALAREGITPIDPERGVKELLTLLNSNISTAEILIIGRLGSINTRKFIVEPLPLLRFLEQERVYYPGIELVCDCVLSAENDLYLGDHLYEGMQLFPAVIGIEAMVQAASAIAGESGCSSVEDIELLKPIMVLPGGKTRIRIMAQAVDGGVNVAIRSEESNFTMDHFRGHCVFASPVVEIPVSMPVVPDSRLPILPTEDLYGGLLFQGAMFQHLTAYRQLTASSCIAEVKSGGQTMFGRYFPQKLLTQVPAVRDVFLHAVQPCVPQDHILPVSIDAVRFLKPLKDVNHLFVHAIELQRTASEYVYDVNVFSENGERVEMLKGFRCRAVGKRSMRVDGKAGPVQIHQALLAPYIERKIHSTHPHLHLSVAADFGTEEFTEKPADPIAGNNSHYEARKSSSRHAMIQAMQDLLALSEGYEPDGEGFDVSYLADGQPRPVLPVSLEHLQSALSVSASHHRLLTLGIASLGSSACDVERIEHRIDAAWEDLLGPEGMQLSQQIVLGYHDQTDVARTRVWSILECLRKINVSHPVLLQARVSLRDECIAAMLHHDGHDVEIITEHIRLLPVGEEIIIAILIPVHEMSIRPEKNMSNAK